MNVCVCMCVCVCVFKNKQDTQVNKVVPKTFFP